MTSRCSTCSSRTRRTGGGSGARSCPSSRRRRRRGGRAEVRRRPAMDQEARMAGREGIDSVGRKDFVQEHGLLTEEQVAAGTDAADRIERDGIRTVRIAWADQHGIPRGKFVSAHDFGAALRNGFDFSGATLVMDTTNHLFSPLFTEGGGFGIPEFTGFPDVQLVPDPTTFVVLPWAPQTGWVLCDMYFSNGKPVPFSTRAVLRS